MKAICTKTTDHTETKHPRIPISLIPESMWAGKMSHIFRIILCHSISRKFFFFWLLTPVNVWAVDSNESCGGGGMPGIRLWHYTCSGSCCTGPSRHISKHCSLASCQFIQQNNSTEKVKQCSNKPNLLRVVITWVLVFTAKFLLTVSSNLFCI